MDRKIWFKHKAPNITLPVCAKRVLPAHEQHVALAIGLVAIADADTMGVETVFWTILEHRLVVNVNDLAFCDVNIHKPDR